MNWENVCRTCLRVPEVSANLFDDDNDLVKKIETIAPVQLENIKELPSKICEECLRNVTQFYNFRKVILNTDHDLRTRLETLNDTKYTTKPRSKIKYYEPENDTNSCTELKLGNDDRQSDSETSNYDETIQKALASNKMFKCKHCKQIFTSRIKLHNHKRNKHTSPGVCNICGTVVRADNLSKHIKLHWEAPCKCDQCGKTFKNSESLRTHKFVHSDVLYTCEICGRTFKLKAEHSRHLKYHQDPDIRKTACTLCGKKVCDLKKHMLTHTGEKPYVCTECNKGFCSTYGLKIHTRQHTNEKPYQCEFCSCGFTQKVSLMTHLKAKHGVF